MANTNKRDNIMYCTNCGNLLHKEAFACPECEKFPFEENKFCNICGSTISNTQQIICLACAAVLEKESAPIPLKRNPKEEVNKKAHFTIKEILTYIFIVIIILISIGIHKDDDLQNRLMVLKKIKDIKEKTKKERLKTIFEIKEAYGKKDYNLAMLEFQKNPSVGNDEEIINIIKISNEKSQQFYEEIAEELRPIWEDQRREIVWRKNEEIKKEKEFWEAQQQRENALRKAKENLILFPIIIIMFR